jgi:hypothetical protein
MDGNKLMPSIGDLVYLNHRNGRVTDNATWTSGKQSVSILFVANVFKGQRAEVFDWEMIRDTLELSSTQLIAGEILTTLLSQDASIQRAFYN